jgi:hypothetical protein
MILVYMVEWESSEDVSRQENNPPYTYSSMPNATVAFIENSQLEYSNIYNSLQSLLHLCIIPLHYIYLAKHSGLQNTVAYKTQWPIKTSGLQNTVAYKNQWPTKPVAYRNQWPTETSGLQNTVIISVFLYTVCPNPLYSIPHTTETLQS